jgi:hypothetical protein
LTGYTERSGPDVGRLPRVSDTPVSDRERLRGLTQFLTQFGFSGSATSL